MKNINEELEENSPRWDGERWIEPDEVLENEETVADNATNETCEAYWKSKEGRCLACDVPIAIQNQYCPKCEAFLIEAHNATRP